MMYNYNNLVMSPEYLAKSGGATTDDTILTK